MWRTHYLINNKVITASNICSYTSYKNVTSEPWQLHLKDLIVVQQLIDYNYFCELLNKEKIYIIYEAGFNSPCTESWHHWFISRLFSVSSIFERSSPQFSVIMDDLSVITVHFERSSRVISEKWWEVQGFWDFWYSRHFK